MKQEIHIDIVPLEEPGLPSLMQLKNQLKWNQSADDLRRFLLLSPDGCFVAVHEGAVVGSITTVCYEQKLAWIGMMMVDPQFRRRGIARKLMNHALVVLSGKGVAVIKLDATPEGFPLYESLGFETEALIERWEGTASGGPVGEPIGEPVPGLVEMEEGHFPLVLELDRKAFGVDRSALLQSLKGGSPLLSFSSGGELQGYGFARNGTHASYIGPLIAARRNVAEQLLEGVLNQLVGQKIYFDANIATGFEPQYLSSKGFIKQRDLIRMSYGEKAPFGLSSLVYGIAGPALG